MTAIDGFRVALTMGATANLSSYYVLAAGATQPRQLQALFADTVNVKDFGAVGDGEVPQRVSRNLRRFRLSPRMQQRHERWDGARLSDGVLVGEVGVGEVPQHASRILRRLRLSTRMQQRHERWDGACLSDGITGSIAGVGESEQGRCSH